jgi:cytidylate kinase
MTDEDKLLSKLKDFDMHFEGSSCFVGEEDISEKIRNEEVGKLASSISAFSSIRQEVLELQRGFAKPPGLVADGRDMGTVVFPKADLKIFLEASANSRAERRYNELKNKGLDVSLPLLLEQMVERDERDRGRSLAPLIPAEDAVLIDTSLLSASEVTASVLRSVRGRGWSE